MQGIHDYVVLVFANSFSTPVTVTELKHFGLGQKKFAEIRLTRLTEARLQVIMF